MIQQFCCKEKLDAAQSLYMIIYITLFESILRTYTLFVFLLLCFVFVAEINKL